MFLFLLALALEALAAALLFAIAKNVLELEGFNCSLTVTDR